VKGWLKNFFAGCLIGIAAVIPGFSGGVVAIALGLYERILQAVGDFFREPKKKVRFLAPLALGSAAAMLVFSGVVSWLLENYREPVLFFFIGLVCGSVPSFLEKANQKGFRIRYLLATVLALLLLVLVHKLDPRSSGTTPASFPMLLFSGGILAVGIIVPGISSSFLLLYLGTYEVILKGISTFSAKILVPVGLGTVIFGALCVKGITYLFEHYHEYAYYAVFGLLLGSVFLIIPPLQWNWQLLVDLLLLLGGFFLVFSLDKRKAGT